MSIAAALELDTCSIAVRASGHILKNHRI